MFPGSMLGEATVRPSRAATERPTSTSPRIRSTSIFSAHVLRRGPPCMAATQRPATQERWSSRRRVTARRARRADPRGRAAARGRLALILTTVCRAGGRGRGFVLRSIAGSPGVGHAWRVSGSARDRCRPGGEHAAGIDDGRRRESGEPRRCSSLRASVARQEVVELDIVRGPIIGAPLPAGVGARRWRSAGRWCGTRRR